MGEIIVVIIIYLGVLIAFVFANEIFSEGPNTSISRIKKLGKGGQLITIGLIIVILVPLLISTLESKYIPIDIQKGIIYKWGIFPVILLFFILFPFSLVIKSMDKKAKKRLKNINNTSFKARFHINYLEIFKLKELLPTKNYLLTKNQNSYSPPFLLTYTIYSHKGLLFLELDYYKCKISDLINNKYLGLSDSSLVFVKRLKVTDLFRDEPMYFWLNATTVEDADSFEKKDENINLTFENRLDINGNIHICASIYDRFIKDRDNQENTSAIIFKMNLFSNYVGKKILDEPRFIQNIPVKDYTVKLVDENNDSIVSHDSMMGENLGILYGHEPSVYGKFIDVNISYSLTNEVFWE